MQPDALGLCTLSNVHPIDYPAVENTLSVQVHHSGGLPYWLDIMRSLFTKHPEPIIVMWLGCHSNYHVIWQQNLSPGMKAFNKLTERKSKSNQASQRQWVQWRGGQRGFQRWAAAWWNEWREYLREETRVYTERKIEQSEVVQRLESKIRQSKFGD